MEKYLQFKPEILLTKTKKPILVSEEKLQKIFIFTYKDKFHKINYEQYSVEINNIDEKDIYEYIKLHYIEMLDNFNKKLRPYESKRIFLNAYEISTKIYLTKI